MIRLLVADDHEIVREGLRGLIAAQPDLELAAAAADGREALACARRVPWDLAVLDVDMPHLSGLEVLGHLQAEFPDRPVIMLSFHDPKQFARHVLKAGARGFVCKGGGNRALLEAIRAVNGGQRYVCPGLTLPDDDSEMTLPHEDLTRRQRQVFERLARGQAVSEIAADLSLSVKTIHSHRHALLERLGLRTNADVVQYAVNHGLSHF